MTTKPATVLASEARVMKSKHTGRKYRISISLPYASFKSDLKAWPFNEPLERWPVVYVTDGDCYFGLVTAIVRPRLKKVQTQFSPGLSENDGKII